MEATLNKGDTQTKFGDLGLTFSRGLKKKTVVKLLTPEQHKKQEIEKRSNCQNSAIHMVCNDLFKNVGEMSAQDYYFEFKRNYLAFKIKVDDADYAGKIADIEALELVMDKKSWRRIADQIYTHRDASVKQFHNAFNDFCTVHASRGNQFRHPSDYQAMMQDEFYQELIK